MTLEQELELISKTYQKLLKENEDILDEPYMKEVKRAQRHNIKALKILNNNAKKQ